jgi:hypothetical protein
VKRTGIFEDRIRLLLQLRAGNATSCALYDEHRVGVAEKTPLSVSTRLSEELPKLLDPSNKKVRAVVLTGDAGDGKTFLCRQFAEALDDQFKHRALNPIEHIEDLDLIIVKDASELDDQEQESVQNEIERTAMAGSSGPKLLLAANEGKLRALVTRTKCPQAYESMLEAFKHPDRIKPPIYFFDLNMRTMAEPELLDAFIDAVLEPLLGNHEICISCPAGTIDRRCPILANIEDLGSGTVRQRLHWLLYLAELCDYHVTIRSLLSLLANLVTAGKDCSVVKAKAAKSSDSIWDEWREAHRLHNQLFDPHPDAGPVDRLSVELQDVDPAYGGNHRIDRRAASKDRNGSLEQRKRYLFFHTRDENEALALLPFYSFRKFYDLVFRLSKGEVVSDQDPEVRSITQGLNRTIDPKATETDLLVWHPASVSVDSGTPRLRFYLAGFDLGLQILIESRYLYAELKPFLETLPRTLVLVARQGAVAVAHLPLTLHTFELISLAQEGFVLEHALERQASGLQQFRTDLFGAIKATKLVLDDGSGQPFTLSLQEGRMRISKP